MSSLAQFSIVLALIAIVLILAVFKGSVKDAVAYFKSDEGLKVLKGIVLFMAFGVVLAAMSMFANSAEAAQEPEGEFFAYGQVFVGIDHTKKLSPQCDAGGPNDKLTSNGGIRVNIYQSADKRFEFNSKYTHHSCAFSQDREQYDALGVELTYRIW